MPVAPSSISTSIRERIRAALLRSYQPKRFPLAERVISTMRARDCVELLTPLEVVEIHGLMHSSRCTKTSRAWCSTHSIASNSI